VVATGARSTGLEQPLEEGVRPLKTKDNKKRRQQKKPQRARGGEREGPNKGGGPKKENPGTNGKKALIIRHAATFEQAGEKKFYRNQGSRVLAAKNGEDLSVPSTRGEGDPRKRDAPILLPPKRRGLD